VKSLEVIVLILCLTATAIAQEANSFEQLQVLVEPDDEIRVVEPDGTSSRGRIVTLSRELLELSVDGVTRQLTPSQIAEIRKRGDSLGNGALNGALIGLAFGGTLAILVCVGGDCDGLAAGVVLGSTLYGTGIGVGVDALIRSERTIYRPSVPSSARGFNVSPILGKDRQGVRFSIGF
jgi:hypothetical protein